MDKKLLYTYDDQGNIKEYYAYIKMNIRSGFQVSDELNHKEEMIRHIETNYIRSKIYPESLLYSDKELLKDRLYFERKDICQTLKGNSKIKKFSSPEKIIAFLTLIENKANKYFLEIKEYNPRLLECLNKTINFTHTIVRKDFSPLLIELGEFSLNLKNICVYLIEDVVDSLSDILFTVKQLRTSFLYNVETIDNPGRSILILINDLIDLEKRMKEAEVAILFKKIQTEDYQTEGIDSKLEEILELPEDQVYNELQKYIKDEIETEKEKAQEYNKNQKGENEDDKEGDPNIFLICDDPDMPKLSIKKTIEFIENELNKIDSLLQQSNI